MSGRWRCFSARWITRSILKYDRSIGSKRSKGRVNSWHSTLSRSRFRRSVGDNDPRICEAVTYFAVFAVKTAERGHSVRCSQPKGSSTIYTEKRTLTSRCGLLNDRSPVYGGSHVEYSFGQAGRRERSACETSFRTNNFQNRRHCPNELSRLLDITAILIESRRPSACGFYVPGTRRRKFAKFTTPVMRNNAQLSVDLVVTTRCRLGKRGLRCHYGT